MPNAFRMWLKPERDIRRMPSRRSFLQSSGAALIAIGAAGRRALAQSRAAFDVAEKSIAQLQAAMAGGQVTSEQLVERYLTRIRAYDQAGPRLNAVIFVNPNAAADARALDVERKERGPRGPLHGIPVLLKDNFDTSDMPTTGGSLALRGIVPKQDAFQVLRLRRAGAVLLGKLNLHELALGLTTVSSYGGQTLNPYDVMRAPGGSSGGSGVAAAACFAAFTMGTDTSGSIRIPSSHNSASWACDRRSDSRAGRASSRSATHRTPAGRWREPSRTSPSSSMRPSGTTRPIRSPRRAAEGRRAATRRR